MKKILSVDTTKAAEIQVDLIIGSKIYRVTSQQRFGSQVLLLLIQRVLENSKIDFKDLDEIKVNTGPGSYTGLKVGVAVANALGFALKIPVNGKEREVDITY